MKSNVEAATEWLDREGLHYVIESHKGRPVLIIEGRFIFWVDTKAWRGIVDKFGSAGLGSLIARCKRASFLLTPDKDLCQSEHS